MSGEAEVLASGVSEPGSESLRIPDLSDDDVQRLVREMDFGRVASVPNYLPPEDLRRAQDFVQAAVRNSGGEYVVFTGKEAVAGTPLQALADDDVFRRLVRRIYEQGTGRSAPPQRIYQVLRCLAGKSGRRQTYIFHYDSFVVTLILPIVIPQQAGRGRLIVSRRSRTIRPFYLLNLVDKMLVDNKFTQWVLRLSMLSGLARFTHVEMAPGSLYVFWGYRSLHTTEPSDPGAVRSTAVYHFGDPHAGSALRRRLGRVQV